MSHRYGEYRSTGSSGSHASSFRNFSSFGNVAQGPMGPPRSNISNKPPVTLQEDMNYRGSNHGGMSMNRGMKRSFPEPLPPMLQDRKMSRGMGPDMGHSMDRDMGRSMDRDMGRSMGRDTGRGMNYDMVYDRGMHHDMGRDHGNMGPGYMGTSYHGRDHANFDHRRNEIDNRRVDVRDRLGPALGRENLKVSIGAGSIHGGRDDGRGLKTAARKHPAHALTVFFPDAKYEEVTNNCRHQYKNISYKLTIPSKNNAVFVGTGVSFLLRNAIKMAKHEAAVKCLRYFGVPGCSSMVDHLSEKDKSTMKELKLEFDGMPASKKVKTIEGVDHPVNIVPYVIKLYGPGVEYKFDTLGTHPNTTMKCTLTVQGKKFEEVGKSKKDAKDRVTEVCIKIFKQHPPPRVAVYENNVRVGGIETDDVKSNSNTEKPNPDVDETTAVDSTPATEEAVESEQDKTEVVPTKQGEVKNQKTGKLDTSPITPNDNLVKMVYDLLKDKEFDPLINVAGIILMDSPDDNFKNYEQGKVVSVATGKNVIFPQTFKTDGTIVHDSSADVLVVRAFRSYLYDELEKAINGQESVLEKTEEKYRLKPQYKLVLVKNQPPTGDAIVMQHFIAFNKGRRSKPQQTSDTSQHSAIQCYVQSANSEVSFNPNNMKVYTEKTINKNNMVKHPIASPSDKMTVRNIVGIQGALLSQLLEPIYFSKFVFRDIIKDKEMNRTLYQRIESVLYKVPHPYKINKPKLGQSKVDIGKPNHKITHLGYSGWGNANTEWETIKSTLGLAQGNPQNYPSRQDYADEVEYYTVKLQVAKELKASLKPSLLCKRALYQRYVAVCGKLGKELPDSYLQCKMQATEYHNVKLSVLNAFTAANCGTWPKKTVNVDDFKVTESEVTDDNVCMDG